jgi:hypothetical protein
MSSSLTYLNIDLTDEHLIYDIRYKVESMEYERRKKECEEDLRKQHLERVKDTEGVMCEKCIDIMY